MSVTNGYHPVRLSSIADELDEIDPRIRGQLVAPAEPAPKAKVRERPAPGDVDVVDRGPDNAHGAQWRDEKRALELLGKRRCTRCRHVQPVAEFSGRQAWCRTCFSSYGRERTRAGNHELRRIRATTPKKVKPRGVAAAAPPATSKNVLQMIAKLRVIVEERDQLKSQVDRLRKERDQAVAELNQLLSDVANAIR